MWDIDIEGGYTFSENNVFVEGGGELETFGGFLPGVVVDWDRLVEVVRIGALEAYIVLQCRPSCRFPPCICETKRLHTVSILMAKYRMEATYWEQEHRDHGQQSPR
jgi:hypothetical protein